MGLFDKVLGKKDQGPFALNEREAFAAVSVAAVAADGVIEQEEVQHIIFNLAEKKLFSGYDTNDLIGILNRMAEAIRKRGVAVVLEAACKALSAEMRQTAFVLAADLVLADGVVEDKEKEFLEGFQKTLQIDDTTALKVVEVMLMKNRG